MTTELPHSSVPPALSSISVSAIKHNHLVNVLPVKDRKQLLKVCQPIELVLGEVISQPGTPTRFAYFPLEGFISLIATSTPDTLTPKTRYRTATDVEVGMVGREGMLGAELVLGVMTAPLQALVQGGGQALRVEQSAFRRELARSEPLRRHLMRYLYVLMSQQATAASCLRFHAIGPRLARWLLMSQDRAHSDHFRLTHEALAHMLGVRRVGITAAASALQRSGLISYRRGELQVLDRPGLEAAACACYGVDQTLYNSMM